MPFSKAELLANPKLLSLLSKNDQASLGLTIPPPLQTPSPPSPSTKPTSRENKNPSKPELQSHAEFLHWIKKLNRSLPTDKPLLAVHADPTSKSGITPGWPDFSLFYLASFLPLFIEFKRPHQGKLSHAQILIFRYIQSLGYNVYVAFSSYEAITTTQNHFNLPTF